MNATECYHPCNYRNDLIPFVTDEEQEGIEKLYGNPNEIKN